MKDLINMDAHPLISNCPRTLKLVALGYLGSCYGCSVPEEYARIVGRSRRQRIAVHPAVLSFLRQDGAVASTQESHKVAVKSMHNHCNCIQPYSLN